MIAAYRSSYIDKEYQEFIDYLEKDLKFFTPSEEVVSLIADGLDEARASDLKESLAAYPDQTETLTDEEIEELAREGQINLKELGELATKTNVPELRRYIGEQIYYALSMIADDDHPDQGSYLDIKGFIVHRLASSLGLFDRKQLLVGVADDFATWLKGIGAISPFWGDIVYGEGDRFMVTSAVEGEKLAKEAVSESNFFDFDRILAKMSELFGGSANVTNKVNSSKKRGVVAKRSFSWRKPMASPMEPPPLIIDVPKPSSIKKIDAQTHARVRRAG